MPQIEISLEQIAQTEALTHSLIDSLPPSIYFEKETALRIKKSKHKALDEKIKNKKMTKQKKHKLAKLDPKINVPISQILDNFDATNQEDDTESEAEEKLVVKSKRRKRKRVDKEEIRNKRIKIEESEEHKALKSKLEEKLAELKARRQASGKNVDKKVKLKMQKQSEIKAKKELRKEKMKSKIKRKLEKKLEKKAEPINPIEKIKKIIENEGMNKVESKKEVSLKVEKSTSIIETPQPVKEKPKKVKFQVEFNKAEDGEPNQRHQKKKKLKFTLSNPRDNLAQVEKAKRQMAKLQEKDPDKAKAIQEKQTWAKAINKAKGIKVRDDETILKKSIRKRELLKKRSKKQWNKRIGFVEKGKKERQERRQANLQKRKEENLKRKIKKCK